MVKTILTTSRGNFAAFGITTAGAIQYWKLATTALLGSTSEATQEIPYQTAGTVSKLYVRIIANSTSAPSILMVRKNRLDTGLTIPIPAGAVGEFEDSVNIVTVTPGDKLDYRTVSGGTGTFTMSLISVIFDATTNCVTKFAFPHVNISAASTSGYIPLSGSRSGSAATEASIEHIIKVPGTFKNAYVYTAANPRTTSTIITLRKNRTATPITFTYAVGEVASKEDTSNLVSYVMDDKITWQQTTGAGTENLGVTHAIEYETTTGYGFITAGSAGATGDITVAPSITEYYTVGGAAIEGITSEADAQMKVRERFTFSLLTLYARANTITAPSTFTLRKNGVDTAMSVSIGASAVGYFVDSTHTVEFEPNDLISYKLTTGGTGTLMTIEQMSVWTLPTPLPPAVVEQPSFGGGRVRRVYLGKRVIEEPERKPKTIIKRINAGKSQPLLISSARRLMLLEDQPGVTIKVTGIIKKPERKIKIKRTKLPASQELTVSCQRLVIPDPNIGVTVAFNSVAVLNASQISLRLFDINMYDRRNERLQRLHKLFKITSYFQSGEN